MGLIKFEENFCDVMSAGTQNMMNAFKIEYQLSNKKMSYIGKAGGEKRDVLFNNREYSYLKTVVDDGGVEHHYYVLKSIDYVLRVLDLINTMTRDEFGDGKFYDRELSKIEVPEAFVPFIYPIEVKLNTSSLRFTDFRLRDDRDSNFKLSWTVYQQAIDEIGTMLRSGFKLVMKPLSEVLALAISLNDVTTSVECDGKINDFVADTYSFVPIPVKSDFAKLICENSFWSTFSYERYMSEYISETFRNSVRSSSMLVAR